MTDSKISAPRSSQDTAQPSVEEQIKKALVHARAYTANLYAPHDEYAQPYMRSVIAELEIAQSALARLQEEHEKALRQLAHEEQSHEATIDQRDRAEEWADKLAYAIASEDQIGEHSNLNNPWSNALEALEAKEAEFERLQEEHERLKAERDAADGQASGLFQAALEWQAEVARLRVTLERIAESKAGRLTDEDHDDCIYLAKAALAPPDPSPSMPQEKTR